MPHPLDALLRLVSALPFIIASMVSSPARGASPAVVLLISSVAVVAVPIFFGLSCESLQHSILLIASVFVPIILPNVVLILAMLPTSFMCSTSPMLISVLLILLPVSVLILLVLFSMAFMSILIVLVLLPVVVFSAMLSTVLLLLILLSVFLLTAASSILMLLLLILLSVSILSSFFLLLTSFLSTISLAIFFILFQALLNLISATTPPASVTVAFVFLLVLLTIASVASSVLIVLVKTLLNLVFFFTLFPTGPTILLTGISIVSRWIPSSVWLILTLMFVPLKACHKGFESRLRVQRGEILSCGVEELPVEWVPRSQLHSGPVNDHIHHKIHRLRALHGQSPH
mmetsp:Transcript_53957/g.89010  ORF Transcript_53957/g.89010 Transcript_53957/m.89010 type:complete len:344 (+) Transcript_53957:1484-2515(+)